jgi:predicted AlkP superfamily phosphohydrolase/phosphomutase
MNTSTLSRRAVLGLAVLLAAMSGCGEAKPPEPTTVLLVGVDGFEWNVALPMLRDGKLPNLRALMEEGTYGLLETQQPTRSPAIWTTIATSKPPERHGIQSFLRSQDPPILFSSTDRQSKAFWNILSEQGRTVDCIGWWVTFPVEQINGVMIAQANTFSVAEKTGMKKGSLIPGIEGQVHPPERQDEFFKVVEEVDQRMPRILEEITEGETPPADAAESLDVTKWAFRADAIYTKLAEQLLSEQPPTEVVAVYFGSTDVVGHRFWRYMEANAQKPNVGEPRSFPGWSKVIRHAYEEADRSIGALRRKLPPNSTMIVLSDHGMRPWGHNDAPPAFFAAAGTGIKKLGGKGVQSLVRADLTKVGSVMDILPTLLALTGVPIAKDMEGHVMEGILTQPVRPRPDAIETYDTPDWVEARTKGAASVNDTDPERLEQLRALGYIQ